MNWLKLAVPSHSEPLWREKIGKVVNWVKLDVPSHFEPLQWKRIGKIVNSYKIGHSELFCTTSVGEDHAKNDQD